jgi:hypothetical protein
MWQLMTKAAFWSANQMILSHSHKFIAFKTRKTGGTSFEIALSGYLAANDVITPIAPDDEAIRASLGFTGPQNHALPGVTGSVAGGKFYNHMGAEELRSMVPAPIFDGYAKVAIVRNPFDYVVSWYFWERSRIAETSREDFRRWLVSQFERRREIEAEYRQRRRPNPGVFSSNRMITHIGDNCAMDIMLRYEHFQEDAARFATTVGLPASLTAVYIEIRAKGNYRPAAATALTMFEGFTEGEAMIRTSFAEDIEKYGYELT